MLLATEVELQEYVKRIERQTEVLTLSPIFTDEDRKQIQECFDGLTAICKARIESIKINNPGSKT